MADLGMTAAQLANAERIVSIGKQRGMSNRDIQIALTVALTESNLQNYANSNVPESLQIPHDKVGSDHMSVGVFQQQVGIWGTAPQLMDVTQSTHLFFDALEKVSNRDAMTIPQAAQTVQRSAFSDGSNYAEDLPLAQKVWNSLAGLDVSASTMKVTGNTNPLAWIQDAGNLQRVGLFALGGIILIIVFGKLFAGTKVVKFAVGVASKGIVK